MLHYRHNNFYAPVTEVTFLLLVKSNWFNQVYFILLGLLQHLMICLNVQSLSLIRLYSFCHFLSAQRVPWISWYKLMATMLLIKNAKTCCLQLLSNRLLTDFHPVWIRAILPVASMVLCSFFSPVSYGWWYNVLCYIFTLVYSIWSVSFFLKNWEQCSFFPIG